MRLRCLAFLPPAAGMTALSLLLASSIVSGLESHLVRPAKAAPSGPFELVRYETECEMLERRIQEVARDVQSCQALPGCLESENICPDAMQRELAHEYERLRASVVERCTGVPTYVTRVAATCPSGAPVCTSELCSEPASDRPRLTRDAMPGTFLF